MVARDAPGGAAYNDLRNLSRKSGRSFQQLLAMHALDGFLARLATSAHAGKLVLKGGVLLAAFDLRRPTRDVDLQAQDLTNDSQAVLALVRSIAALPFDDGLVFETAAAATEAIRDDDQYSGVRVSLNARLGTARVPFHVDVNVGDPITPAPQDLMLARVLADPVRLRGYPMAMIHAEKVVTAVARGSANTRWRDFGDVYSRAGRHAIDGDELTASLRSVAAYRKVDLLPLADVLDTYAGIAQGRYATWRSKQMRDDLPAQFQELLDRVHAFADPALAGAVSGLRWDPAPLVWG